MIISKNTKIFLIIFSSLMIIITIGAIIYKNNHKNETNESHIIIESAQRIPEISDEEIYEQNYSKVVRSNFG